MKKSNVGKKIYVLYIVIGLILLIFSFVVGFLCAYKVNVDDSELNKYNGCVNVIRNNPLEFSLKIIFYTLFSALFYEVGRYLVDKKMGYRMRVEINKDESKQKLTIDGLKGTMVKEGEETRKDRFMCKYGGLIANAVIIIFCYICFKGTDNYSSKTSLLVLSLINIVMILFNLVRLFFTQNKSFVFMGKRKI